MNEEYRGKYGCWWEGGTGVSPEGEQCGECYPCYEDKCPKLEQRRKRPIVVLPCRVGDTIYRLSKRYGRWEVLPREVVSLTYRLDHLYRVVWDIFSTTTDRLGVTAFLTFEEAEKEAKKRNSKKGDRNAEIS